MFGSGGKRKIMLIRRTGRNSDPTQKPCQRASLWFRQNNPIRGADAVIGLMRSVHFDAQGFTRTSWDFFSAFALFSSIFLLVATALARLLGLALSETS